MPWAPLHPTISPSLKRKRICYSFILFKIVCHFQWLLHKNIITQTSLHLNIYSLLRMLQYLWHGRVHCTYTHHYSSFCIACTSEDSYCPFTVPCPPIVDRKSKTNYCLIVGLSRARARTVEIVMPFKDHCSKYIYLHSVLGYTPLPSVPKSGMVDKKLDIIISSLQYKSVSCLGFIE